MLTPTGPGQAGASAGAVAWMKPCRFTGSTNDCEQPWVVSGFCETGGSRSGSRYSLLFGHRTSSRGPEVVGRSPQACHGPRVPGQDTEVLWLLAMGVELGSGLFLVAGPGGRAEGEGR